MISILVALMAVKSGDVVQKRTALAWLLLIVSFSGFAEGIHPLPLRNEKGMMAHYRMIDTSERADEHISEKVPELVVKR